MYIEIFGIQSINKEINESEEAVKSSITLDFDIQERENDSLITIVVEQRGHIAASKKNFIVSSRTGFQISDGDLAFLKHPLNEQSVKLCVELSQTAIAHNRVFALIEDEARNEEEIKINQYLSIEELTKKTKHSLAAKFN